MKRSSLVFALVSLLIPTGYAQSNPFGLPNIQNYHFSETGGGEQNWCITRDFRGMVYVGNHEQGILEYDGSTWRTLPVPGDVPVRSLVPGDQGYIYVGLEGGFGRLEPDRQGQMHYVSLSDIRPDTLISNDVIWKTYVQDGQVYFCGLENIFVYDPDTEAIQIIQIPPNGFLSFFVDNQLYTGNYERGLMQYDGNSFTLVKGGEYFRESNVSGMVPFDAGQILIATFNKGLFLLDPDKGRIDSTFISPSLKEELNTATIVHLKIHRNNIYVGTLFSGLFILDRQGNLQEVLSDREGLIDNAMLDLYIPSEEQGSASIWIAHWKGVSKVDIYSPFRSVSVGQGRGGLAGRNAGEIITDITEFQGQMFVSTMGGIQRSSGNADRPGFRPLRGIREEIFDLQVMEPEAGRQFLLAAGQIRTYVIDQDLRVSSLEIPGRKLLTDPDNPGIFYTGQDVFTGYRYQNGQWKVFLEVELERVTDQLCLDREGFIWISAWAALLRLELTDTGRPRVLSYGADKGLPQEEPMRLFTDPDSRELLVGTSEGFYHYEALSDSFKYDSLYNELLPEGGNRIMTFHRGAEGLYWFSFDNEYRGWSILGARRNRNGFEPIYDRPFRSLSRAGPTDVFYTDGQDELWFSKSNQLFHFDPDQVTEEIEPFHVLMRNVRISGDSVLFHGTHFLDDAAGHLQPSLEQPKNARPDLKYLFRNIEFDWSAPYFRNERQIRYSYFLDGFSEEWSDWDRSRSAKFTNLPHGRYNMQVKARNVFGEESPPASYIFTILRPWYATFLAISLYVILIATLTVFIILYTRNLRRRNELLVAQNREIELQKTELQNLNDEITSQRDEIEAQRDAITLKNELIGRQNRAMTDSIHYARKIQDAVLPAREVMRFLLPKHFIFYQPRDIVSGDFFWVDKRDESVLVAVADCTGHGVPGAFMSMLGISLLNEISSKYSGYPTNEIMDELRDQVIASLGQTGDKYEARDGMEMGLVEINTKTREVQFTGAMHHLYAFQNGKLVVVHGDRMPVGIHSEGSTPFSAKKLSLDRGDTLYLFSDGYADQFGGAQRKKFGSTRLKALLTRIQPRIMHDQADIIEKEFDQWKGEEEQIDDVLMIGIKL